MNAGYSAYGGYGALTGWSWLARRHARARRARAAVSAEDPPRGGGYRTHSAAAGRRRLWRCGVGGRSGHSASCG